MRLKIIIFLLFLLAINNICLAKDNQFLISGAELLDLGKLDEAIVDLKRTFANEEVDAAYFHFLLGAIYNVQGKYSEAINEFKEVLRVKPSSAELIKTILGNAYQENLVYSDIEAYKNNLPGNLT